MSPRHLDAKLQYSQKINVLDRFTQQGFKREGERPSEKSSHLIRDKREKYTYVEMRVRVGGRKRVKEERERKSLSGE